MQHCKTTLMTWAFFLLNTCTHAQPAESIPLYIDTSSQVATGGNTLYIGFPKEYDTYATAAADTLLKVEKISKTSFSALANGEFLLL